MQIKAFSRNSETSNCPKKISKKIVKIKFQLNFLPVYKKQTKKETFVVSCGERS
jgi:hypothetical protein